MEIDHDDGPAVVVRGVITLNVCTELLFLDTGSVIGDLYCKEAMLLHVRLLQGDIRPDIIFMDDNARSHRSADVQQPLESEDIIRMNWLQRSRLIKHGRNALGKHLAARLHPPENTQQLKQMLIEEWALLPQKLLDNLVLSDGVKQLLQ
ncbi:transposable element Tcb2 transposase [Trichonephila clavipes]|uniref:Transposable element Tcb2 transposase n=1 Tax=Trichonephila clavipes TaxID=2585209 RepID=A0A8X6RDW0_TRICX|nr:transposable element Tcb2 transposase [Trichonephila clavipes]